MHTNWSWGGAHGVRITTLSGSLWHFFFLIGLCILAHLFLICSASVSSLPFSVLYHAHPCTVYSIHISSFLEEISSLSLSCVFAYSFAGKEEQHPGPQAPCRWSSGPLVLTSSWPLRLPVASAALGFPRLLGSLSRKVQHVL